MTPVFVPGNRLTLLKSGAQYFPALLAAIDAACSSVNVETYIFEADGTGREVANALSRASRRGVTVKVLVDGYGGGAFPTTLMPDMLAAGVHVMLYQSDSSQPLWNWRRWRLRRLRRLHRKLAVVDQQVAFVAGINLIDDLDLATPTLPPRFDFAVQIEGPLVASAQRAMNHLWRRVAEGGVKRGGRGMQPVPGPPVGDDSAALVIRDNIRHRRDIEEAYLDAIRHAQREVIVATAYFLPGKRFQQALIGAARRGVSVKVLLQGRAEYRLLYYATQALYGALLHGGVRIFEYRRSFLHAKVALVDLDWATVGSSNIDPFSLLLAQEANVVTRAPAFVAALRSNLIDALENGALELKPDAWRHARLAVRILRFGSYQLVRLLLGAVGFGFEESARSARPP